MTKTTDAAALDHWYAVETSADLGHFSLRITRSPSGVPLADPMHVGATPKWIVWHG